MQAQRCTQRTKRERERINAKRGVAERHSPRKACNAEAYAPLLRSERADMHEEPIRAEERATSVDLPKPDHPPENSR